MEYLHRALDEALTRLSPADPARDAASITASTGSAPPSPDVRSDVRIDREFLRPTVPVFTTIGGLCSANVHLKLEGLNPTGSIKLKTALQLIDDLEASGGIQANTRIVESSSGNLGVALAMVCANRGYRFTCVTDPNTSRHAIRTMQALGAQVVKVEQRDAHGGYLGTRIAWIREQVARDAQWVWVNQYANPSNWRAHYRWTAPEIFSAYPDVDHLFIGAGTTGTLMGCLRYVRAHRLPTRVIAVDALGSVTFGGLPGPRRIPGLGTSCRPPLCELAQAEPPDAIVYVAEADTLRMCRTLAARGLLAGGSTGSVLHAVWKSSGDIGERDTVVAVAPDMGDKYLDTLYDPDWAATCLGADSGLYSETSLRVETVTPSLS